MNHDRLFKPASVIKLAVLVAAYRARPKMPPAQFERLRPDLERMITISDNPATRRLVRRLGARQVNAAFQVLGIHRFRFGNRGSRAWLLQGSQAAPADTALLLAKLARREVVSAQACDEMLALLGAQKKRRRIPAGLSFGHVPGLSAEVVQRLTHVRPDTLGHALRIPGVTPAAVAVLLIGLAPLMALVARRRARPAPS